MSYKQFFLRFLVSIAAILGCMGIFVFIWDPCNYYRITDNKLKYVASSYINAGVIRNADYNTVIIGSSLSQNFAPQLFRDLLDENVLKVNTGGISLEQRDLFYNCVECNKSVDKYYIEILLSSFNEEDDDLGDTPVYLYDKDQMNDYLYLYGYGTWMQAVPISLAYRVLDICGIELKSMHNLQSVDYIGDWYYRHQIGEDIVKQKYLSGEDAVSAQKLDGMTERMTANVNSKLTTIIDENNEYVFYFPPYSALFWYEASRQGYMDEYLNIKEKIIMKLMEYPKVKVYDFQYADFIIDLENYRDSTHYRREINDWMTECFASDRYCVQENNYKENIQALRNLVDEFKEKNNAWLPE